MKDKLKTQHRKGIHILFIFSILHIYERIEEENLVLYLQTGQTVGIPPDIWRERERESDIDID